MSSQAMVQRSASHDQRRARRHDLVHRLDGGRARGDGGGLGDAEESVDGARRQESADRLRRRRPRCGARRLPVRRLFQRRRMLQRRFAHLLQRAIAEDFVAELAERTRQVPVGDPLDPETKVGAIISADHMGKIERHVAAAQAAGARLRSGGERIASDGLFMAATIVDAVSRPWRLRATKCSGRSSSR